LHGQLAQHLRSSSPKDYSPTHRGTWENLTLGRGGVGKSGVLEHKSDNLKRVKVAGKLLGAYRKSRSFERYHSGPPIRRPVRQDRGSQPPPKNPKLQSLLSRVRVWSYGLQISLDHSQGPCEQKPIENFGKKGARAYPELHKFLGYPNYLRNG